MTALLEYFTTRWLFVRVSILGAMYNAFESFFYSLNISLTALLESIDLF